MNHIDGTFEVTGARGPLAFFGSLDERRLAHGYLFVGPGGVGKKTFARRLAQSLLCETPKSTLLGYCTHCPGCRLFAAGTHPDFVASEGIVKIGEPDAGRATNEDNLTSRDLVRGLSFHGYRSAHRVVLLADVGFATHAAANALLKFFEEPPKGVCVILTTSAPGLLLDTIRSRFVEVPFAPLPVADVVAILEGEGVPPERAREAAAVSLGSVSRARAVLEDGDGMRGAAFAWFADALRGRMPDHAFLQLDDRSFTAAEKRARVSELIEIVRIAARDWVALTLGADGVPLLAGDQRALLTALPARTPRDQVAVLAAVGDAERLANTNVSAGLVVQYLRMQLALGGSPANDERRGAKPRL